MSPSRNILIGGLKQLDLNKTIWEVIAILNIMLNTAWPEIASTLRQLADISATRMFDHQPSFGQRHNELIMFMALPSGGGALLREIPPRHPDTFIFDDHLTEGLAGI